MTTTTNGKSASLIAGTKKASAAKNASKGTARDLQRVILTAREDKVTASKLVSSFRRDIGQTIYSNGESDADKVKAIQSSAEALKSQILAAIDRDVERASVLVSIPRGTTGKGGLHHSDVVTEIFAALGKKTAIANNTKALKSAGLLSL